VAALALTPSARRRNLAAVIASMAVTSLIYGLTMPLLALVLDRQGVDAKLIGLSAASQSFAVFAVAPIAPRLLRRWGPARLMLRCIVVNIIAFLMLPLFDSLYAWFPLRFVIGAAGSTLWIAGETWINQIADERSRGRLVGLYGAALSAGFALGPLSLGLTGSEGWTPFLAAAGMMLISTGPLLLAYAVSPRVDGGPSGGLPSLLWAAPTAMLLNLVFAAADGALLSFLPIYFVRLGFDEANALYLLAVLGAGGIASQYPIGWLGDHVDRRLILIVCIASLIAGLALMPLAIGATPLDWLYVFLLGGVLGALYNLGVVLLGERFRGAELATATTLFTVMWNLGSIAGPPLGGAGMAAFAPHGLPLTVAAMFALYLPVPVIDHLRRKRRRKRGDT